MLAGSKIPTQQNPAPNPQPNGEKQLDTSAAFLAFSYRPALKSISA